MKLSQFKFKLPEEQIALYPQSLYREFENEDGTKETVRFTRRDECRLMVLHRKSQTIEMYKRDADGNPIEGEYLDFRNVLDYFDEGDTFIFNDTKVFPARLYGTKEKTDAKIEVFLLRELNEEMRLWDVLVEPARKIRIGNKLFFDDSGTMVAEVIDNTTSRGRTLRFLYDCPHDEFKRELFALGESPLPRYIIDRRESPHGTAEDLEDFQTIYAKNEGAVTAPATGLHFSRELMKRMEIRGMNFAFITLHCSLSAFHDIEVEDDVTAVLEYPNGATGVFIATTGEAPGTNRLEIAAERGKLVYENQKLTFIRNEIPTSQFSKETTQSFATPDKWFVDIPVNTDGSHQHRDIIENFCNAILKGDKLIAPAQEGIRGLELGNAMLLSGLKQKPVELPIDAEEYAEMLEKLVSTSRYVKKVVKPAADVDFSKSFQK